MKQKISINYLLNPIHSLRQVQPSIQMDLLQILYLKNTEMNWWWWVTSISTFNVNSCFGDSLVAAQQPDYICCN